MKKRVSSQLINRRYLLIIISILIIIGTLICSTKFTNIGYGWTEGETGKIKKIPPPTSYGAEYWVMTESTVFLLNPVMLPTFESKNGLKKIVKEYENMIPAYGDDTVAIIPYDLGVYMKKHGFTNLTVVKRTDIGDPDSQKFVSSAKQMKAVLMMEGDLSNKDLSKAFKEGVYYSELEKLYKEGKTKSGWKKLITGGKSEKVADADKKCEYVWTYITKFNSVSRTFDVRNRIDQYLHADVLGVDADNLGSLDLKAGVELRLRYIDFLMTIYTQVVDSTVASKWEKIINKYIDGISELPENDCNIGISAGFAARGWAEVDGKTKMVNIISGCNDFIEAALCIDKDYTLAVREKANAVAKGLNDASYYNRLLEALRKSVKKQKDNKIKVNRTYADKYGLWGSAIISRLLRNKPNIDGTTVSWKSGVWGEEDYIEHLYLKSKYYGTMLVPAYTPQVEPKKTKAYLKVVSTMAPSEKVIEIEESAEFINDKPKLTINLDGSKEKATWDLLFDTNDTYKIKVAFTRTPTSPELKITPQTYVSKEVDISKDTLKKLLNNKIDLHEWIDSSILQAVIKSKEKIEYKYKAEVTITYYNSNDNPIKKNSYIMKTNTDYLTYYKNAPPKIDKPIGRYISEPRAYSELKEGTIYNETFEAMAGVPTTRTLYFASGGSEFVVELEVQYDPDKKATRTYKSVFKGNECEFKEGDTAPNMTLGGQSVNLHGGGTYTKTWSGTIGNDAEAVEGLHEATCPAEPNYDEYEDALEEANDFVDEVNSTILSFTSASDKKTREYSDWRAHISTNTKTDPISTSNSVPCNYKPEIPPDEDGNGGVPGVPCKNEMVTAEPGADGSFTITVTWTVPAHVLCGPCCSHDLPPIEDNWKQEVTFDTLKIIDARVWKIESSYVNGMEEITYTSDDSVKATIMQGDPNIFYNIAAEDTSQAGRLRYSLQQQQHDAVTWYERNSAGEEKRSNKCDGLSGTLCPENKIPVPPGQGHQNQWAKGILYNNTVPSNDYNYHAAPYSGLKTNITNNSTDAIDKQTEEYNRFDTRRKMLNTVTVISDMLILQTSSGDQAVVYFETSQTQESQKNYTDIEVTFEQMWTSNTLSAANWSKDEINIGSYNGEYDKTSTKYKGSGDNSKIATAFDNDLAKVTSGDELNLARVVSTKNFVSGTANKATPSAGQYRMKRPNDLRLFIDKIRQNPVNPNGEYFPGQSYVYYKNILSYTCPDATGLANYYESKLTTNDVGDYGYTIKSSYKVADRGEGSVNSIVVHNPVSVEDAMIISLPSEMDQRATIPKGSAQSLLQEIAALEKCPLSPGLCEYRVHNCKYGFDRVVSSFDFEKVSTKALANPDTGIVEPIKESTGASDEINQNLSFDKFTTDFASYDIVSRGCEITNSLERLVVEVEEKNSYFELGVNVDTSDIKAVRVSFGTSGNSKKSYLSYSSEKGGTYRGNVLKEIIPGAANQTIEYDMTKHSSWREMGTVKRLRFNLDGDNTGMGTYIITKIELVPEGIGTEETPVFTGSEDDTSIIRSLIVPINGEPLSYNLNNGFTIDKNNVFGTGRSLKVNGLGGTRLAMRLTDIGISYQKEASIKVEANINIPANSSMDNMIFSFNGLGFYVPKGNIYGYFINSDGAKRSANHIIVGSNMKLGVVFNFGSINDCKLYVNDVLVTSYTTISNGSSGNGEITEEMIGDNLHFGCWSKDNAYAAQFVMDNLTVTKLAGSTTHTSACYTTFKDHSFTKNYTCDLTHEVYYTGEGQVFTAPEDGTYKLEAWGAQGGYSAKNDGTPGKGGYASGEVYLKKGQTLHVYVGAQGANGSSSNYTGGAFNGGGAGLDEGIEANGFQGGQGGGATDFRLTDGNIIAGRDPYIGDFANIAYSGNISKVTLDTGESAIKIARGSTHTAAALPNLLKRGHTYQLSFEAWTTAANDTIYADALPETLPDLTFNISNSRKVYTATLSSPLSELEGATFRLFASGLVLKGDVYITNIKLCDTSLSTTTATYTIGTGLIDEGGITYGPYVNMLSGTYQVHIYGKNLANCIVDTVSRGGTTSYRIININKTNTHITYYVEVTEDIIKGTGQSGLEFRIFHSGIQGYSLTKQTVSRLEDRILVAGGGGGTGHASNLSPSGDGGGLIGVTSRNNNDLYLGYQASGGSQTAGGTGLRNNIPLSGVNSRSGGFGYGADASLYGAGGGGGWYGGGSSYTAGGGGGSSYIGGVKNGATLTGVRKGMGFARITNLTHKHTEDCPYISSENNVHTHSSSCINSNSMDLINALMLAENGDLSYIRTLLGDPVFNTLKLKEQVIYTWNNWSPSNLKQFREIYSTKLSVSGDNLIVTNTGTDPHFEVPVNLIASSVKKVRIYTRLVGVTSPFSQLFFTNETYPYYTENATSIVYINADNNWQWIEFDLSNNPSWKGRISGLRFDIVGNGAGTGYVEIDQIQLIGYGTTTDGASTKVLATYSGFSEDTRRYGISDGYSPASTTFSNNAIVNSGDLTGLEFVLPINIDNADALQSIRVTMSTTVAGNTGGIYKNNSELAVGIANTNADGTVTITYDTQSWKGAINCIGFDTAAGTILSGTTKVYKIELIGYGIMTQEPTESYVPGIVPVSQRFDYTGNYQTFIAPYTATYILEAYGAQGGGAYGSSPGVGTISGGLGGYAKSIVNLAEGEIAYVFVGGRGGNAPTSYIDGYLHLNNNGGYNGGGSGAGSKGPGGGGATDIRIGGMDLSNRVVVAAGGGGDARNESSKISVGSTPSSNWILGYGSNGPTGWRGSENQYEADTAGGGGGYYGGNSVDGDDPYYAYSGTNYCIGEGSTSSYGENIGHGYAVITWLLPKYEYTPATIQYVEPKPLTTKNPYGFGSLNGEQTGIDATIEMIANLYGGIPYKVNGSVNPIWGCDFVYNTHVCNKYCKEITLLVCNEPHHFGICYDYDNEICWDACGNDTNHKNAEVTQVETADGSTIHVGTFICLDNYFQIYFPNIGDFYGNGAYGLENTSIYRGKGYHDNMSTLEWLREKRVRFDFDVLFNRNGVWEQYRAGEWITLPIRDNSGRVLNYYDFYCLLANDEKIAASVEFQAEAINNMASPGGKEDPYLGDDNADTDCPTYFATEYMTNKTRFLSLWSYHSAYKKSYTDIVGRIGNFIIEDTEDFRYANFFKQTSINEWIVEGVVKKVNADISKNYLTWYNNDGSYGKDIRGVTVSKETNMYDTYGTQSWTNVANSASLPLQAAINNIESLKERQMKLGYNVLFDISTIGNYHHNMQVVPYFYALNLDNDTITPVDVYITMDKEYKPINYFGLMSEYVDANNNFTAEHYALKEKLYEYIMNLDWENEKRRRNYTDLEEAHTKYLGENRMEPVTDASGTVLTYKYLTVPFDNYYSLGTLQMLLPGIRARTFIGSSTVNTVNINGGRETNINQTIDPSSFWYNGQRWHMTLGAPSSAVFVPYRNNRHIHPTEEVIDNKGREIAAYEEIKNGNYVILLTADIKAIGSTYVLAFDQGVNNGVLKIKGKSYYFGEDLPNVLAVYDAQGSAVGDIDFTGTH